MVVLAPLVLSSACLDDAAGPCDDYVAYMCRCHGNSVDCDQLTATYENADQDLQDSCAAELDAQQAQDDERDVACPDGDAGVG